jgi:cytochrome c-type biogenesis protein
MRVVLSPSNDEGTKVRTAVGAGVAILALVVAVSAGLSSSSDGGAPVLFIERISSAIGSIASRPNVWWIYAFLLGAVAAFNPCGIALLPAYLGLYLRDQQMSGSPPFRAWRALRVSGAVAGAFVVLFGVIGAVFSFTSSVLVRSLPWIGLAVGVVLIAVGGLVIGGRTLLVAAPERVADKLGGPAGRAGLRAYGAFGLAYGLASLGCALPLFLALVGTAVASGGPLSALIAFVLYGAGMAVVLGTLTLGVAVLSAGFLPRVRSFARVASEIGGVLLLVSGAYVVYYWLTVGRLLLG